MSSVGAGRELNRAGDTTNRQPIPLGKPWDRQPIPLGKPWDRQPNSGKLRRKLVSVPGFQSIESHEHLIKASSAEAVAGIELWIEKGQVEGGSGPIFGNAGLGWNRNVGDEGEERMAQATERCRRAP